jgi:hypothetical protein
MTAPETITVCCLIGLAAAHSVLGESELLVPLFRADWNIGAPRRPIDTLLRFAWHITSLAWLTIAAIIAEVEPIIAAGWMSMVAAAVGFVRLRWHLAWPVFLFGGLAAFRSTGDLGDQALRTGAWVTAIVLALAGILHVYWAAGGRWLFDRAVPTGGASAFTPGPLLTLAVALALFVFAALVAAAGAGAGPAEVRWLVGAGALVLAVRAIGDTRTAGFTKTIRGTAFAEADDRFFTPLITLLAFGAFGSIVV